MGQGHHEGCQVNVRVRREDPTTRLKGSKGASGAFLAINSVGATRSDEQCSLADCITTVGAVARARPVDGSTIREMASEREVREKESLGILRNVRQGAETWNQQKEEIIQAAPKYTKGPTVRPRKVKLDWARFRK